MTRPVLEIQGVEKARFGSRPNRFLVELEDGRKAHLHDPGRLKELLVPGRELVVKPEDKPSRKTRLDVLAVKTSYWVFIHSGYHSRIAEEVIPGLFGSIAGREVKLGESRIDFVLEDGRPLEVKGCTLMKKGIALFPDAPTERGRRHLLELARQKGALLFLVFHPPARELRPNCETDPRFCKAMKEALSSGVEARAVKLRTRLVGRRLVVEELGEIPVEFVP